MPASFRSVVISLSSAATTPELLHLAAEMARLIGADLRALYVEDESLLDVADVPLAREVDPLRPSGDRWRPLAREQLARDFELAATSVRRRLSDAASAVGVRVEFSVVRADPRSLTLLEELRGHDDFLFVVPAKRAATAARLPAGAMLYAPPGIARRRGDVIALARNPTAAAARLADQIARAAHARLILIDAAGDAEHLQHALGHLHERLIVAGAEAFADADDAAQLAALRRVPVIVVPDSSPA